MKALKPVSIRSSIIIIVVNWSAIPRALLTPPTAIVVKFVLVIIVVVIIVDLRASPAVRPPHHGTDRRSLTREVVACIDRIADGYLGPRWNRIVAVLSASFRVVAIPGWRRRSRRAAARRRPLVQVAIDQRHQS